MRYLAELCTDALAGKRFNQDGMRNSAVNDSSFLDPSPNSFYAAINLRNHTAGDNALPLQERYFTDIHVRNQGRRVILIPQQSSNIRHQN